MDMKIEVVQGSVSGVDRAKDFYSRQLGFNVDIDSMVPGDMRVVQLTPPGSGCSIHLVAGGIRRARCGPSAAAALPGLVRTRWPQ